MVEVIHAFMTRDWDKAWHIVNLSKYIQGGERYFFNHFITDFYAGLLLLFKAKIRRKWQYNQSTDYTTSSSRY